VDRLERLLQQLGEESTRMKVTCARPLGAFKPFVHDPPEVRGA
jgi:hypothetical protein